MTIEVTSKYSIGDKVIWDAQYGGETVVITNVLFDEGSRQFYYEVKGYTFTLDETELSQ